MSMQACQSAGLSAATLESLQALPNVDWAKLWGLIQQYGPLIIKAVEILLPILTKGASWASIEQAILALIAILKP